MSQIDALVGILGITGNQDDHLIRRFSIIERNHTNFDNAKQSLSDHTCMMQFYLLKHADFLYKVFNIDGQVKIESLLVLCLVHDIDETITGDTPHPWKSYLSGLGLQQQIDNETKQVLVNFVSKRFGKLTAEKYLEYVELREQQPRVYKLIKFVDMYEFLMSRIKEVTTGNRNAIPFVFKAAQYCYNLAEYSLSNFDSENYIYFQQYPLVKMLNFIRELAMNCTSSSGGDGELSWDETYVNYGSL